MTRHKDFQYILGEFQRYYCKGQGECQKATDEYTAWLKALKLNDEKSYGQSRESFQWAKDMITRWREDRDNVYYKVLVGFPTKSMNRNVYRERDLLAAAHTLIGLHPSINHKDEYALNPKNPHNRWGIVTIVGARMEDGAVEAILQVPKTAKCPVCNGGLMTELIDTKRIYNVSLEGACVGGTHGPDGSNVCDGFEFTEQGFSLLTTDVLPGIPMSKIFPMESFLAFLPQKPSGKGRSIQIVGLKTTEGELSGYANPDQTIKVVKPDGRGQCPQGLYWSARLGGCIDIQDDTATDGFGKNLDKGGNKASSDLRRPRAETDRPQFIPEGTKVVLDQGNSDGKWLKGGNDDEANRAMGNPKGCEVSDVGIETQQMPGSDKLPEGGTANKVNTAECRTAGDMGKLVGKTNIILDAGKSDRWHPDNDDKWLIEDSPTDRPPKPPPDQPANVGQDCAPGMRWSPKDGMCVFDAPQNESGTYNPTGPCRRGEVYDTKEGRCVSVGEGPNILNEPDTANDKMGKPGTPPIDQPTSSGIAKGECPDGYTFDPDTGQCAITAPQTETIKHGDVRSLSNMDTAKRMYNPSSPTSDVTHGQPADARGMAACRDGMVWDARIGMCVVSSPYNEDIGKTDITTTPRQRNNIINSPTPECPDGYMWNMKLGICAPTDDAGSTGDKSNIPNTTECKTAGDMGKLAGQTHIILDDGSSDRWHPDNDDKWLIEYNRQRLEEPFADYKNFADCVAKNSDKDDPAAYCGSIKAQTEHRIVNHELELSQALSNAARLDAQLSQMRIEYDATVKGLKALVAQHWNAYQLEKDMRLQLEGRLKELNRTVDSHEDKTRNANNERLELETKLQRRERDLTEALENAGKFKKAYEDLQLAHEQTEAKYREALKTNLALNKAVTKSNEDYLKLAREKEETEEQLKHARRLAKHIIVKTRI